MSAAAPKSTRNRSLAWKVGYLVAIGVLMMPLFWLSHPATRAVDPKGGGRPGGKLAQLRKAYKLDEADIGQIDPTTETLRLATLGMRGVASEILWNKANTYQMKKDWTNLRATLDEISKLEPHSIPVWRFQAWNLSYNVSNAFDDYHDKYHWVMEGIKFMQRGVEYNEHEPRLVSDLGWFISNKIGRADEAAQYRKLFKEDDEFHGSRRPELRDNWLVGKETFHDAEARVDEEHPIRGLSDGVFYSNAPLCQFYYAEALEKDGQFDAATARAWKQAGDEWHDLGERELPTLHDVKVRLNDQEMHDDNARQAAAELDKLARGWREKIAAEKRGKLSAAEKAACDTPAGKRTAEQLRLARDAEPRLAVSYEEIARRVTGPSRDEALRLAEKARREQDLAAWVAIARSPVNFTYWRLRARVEQEPQAVAARKAIAEGHAAYTHNDLVRARDGYERGLKLWRIVLDRFPDFKGERDSNTVEDLMLTIGRYRMLLKQLDAPFPKPFILQDIIDLSGNQG
jgi:hypothetical protein